MSDRMSREHDVHHANFSHELGNVCLHRALFNSEAARGRRLQFALDSIPSKSNYDVPMANSLNGSGG
jgi:hypothetical protein